MTFKHKNLTVTDSDSHICHQVLEKGYIEGRTTYKFEFFISIEEIKSYLF